MHVLIKKLIPAFKKGSHLQKFIDSPSSTGKRFDSDNTIQINNDQNVVSHSNLLQNGSPSYISPVKFTSNASTCNYNENSETGYLADRTRNDFNVTSDSPPLPISPSKIIYEQVNDGETPALSYSSQSHTEEYEINSTSPTSLEHIDDHTKIPRSEIQTSQSPSHISKIGTNPSFITERATSPNYLNDQTKSTRSEIQSEQSYSRMSKIGANVPKNDIQADDLNSFEKDFVYFLNQDDASFNPDNLASLLGNSQSNNNSPKKLLHNTEKSNVDGDKILKPLSLNNSEHYSDSSQIKTDERKNSSLLKELHPVASKSVSSIFKEVLNERDTGSDQKITSQSHLMNNNISESQNIQQSANKTNDKSAQPYLGNSNVSESNCISQSASSTNKKNVFPILQFDSLNVEGLPNENKSLTNGGKVSHKPSSHVESISNNVNDSSNKDRKADVNISKFIDLNNNAPKNSNIPAKMDLNNNQLNFMTLTGMNVSGKSSILPISPGPSEKLGSKPISTSTKENWKLISKIF